MGSFPTEPISESYQSGQLEETVNLLSSDFGCSNHSLSKGKTMINDFNFKIMSGVYKKGGSYPTYDFSYFTGSSVSVNIPKSNEELRKYIDNRIHKNPETKTFIYFYLQPRK